MKAAHNFGCAIYRSQSRFLRRYAGDGSAETSGHQEVLVHALDLHLPIGLVGPRFSAAWNSLKSRYPNAKIVCQTEQSDQILEHWDVPTEPTTILLKGSRGMKMECMSTQLQERFQ